MGNSEDASGDAAGSHQLDSCPYTPPGLKNKNKKIKEKREHIFFFL